MYVKKENQTDSKKAVKSVYCDRWSVQSLLYTSVYVLREEKRKETKRNEKKTRICVKEGNQNDSINAA